MLIGKETLVADFLAALWKAMFVYNRVKVGVEFLIAVICSLINVLQRVDVSVGFRIFFRGT